jgi:hypothetical protein
MKMIRGHLPLEQEIHAAHDPPGAHPVFTGARTTYEIQQGFSYIIHEQVA